MINNTFDLTGKVALVTGGAGSIGQAIAAAFCDHGASVLIGSRNAERVKSAVAALARPNLPVEEVQPVAGLRLDVTSDNSVERACRRAVDLFGRLDILVNCAGQMVRRPTFELTVDQFDQLHQTHVSGSLRCSLAAGHIFREQHGGCIINIASVSSLVDLIEVAAYASAKNAILGLTRSLANEWAKFGIRTNAIAPGFIPTDLNWELIVNTDRGRRILEHTPMARFGRPEEMGPPAVFLASDAASFVTGHTLVVDGGFTASGIGDSDAPWAPASAAVEADALAAED